MLKTICSFAVITVGLLFADSDLGAQTWVGLDQDDNNWSSVDNWSSTPSNDGTADLGFSGVTRPDPNVDTAWNVNSLSLNTWVDFALGGSDLTLQGGGMVKDGAQAFTISNHFELGTDQTWTQVMDGAWTLQGGVNLGAHALTLDLTNTSSATGTKINGLVEGGGSLIKQGNGVVTLSHANTYSGGTQIKGGTVAISSDDNLGDANTALILNDGTLQTDAAVTLGAGRTIGLNSGGGTLDSNGFNSTVAGNLQGAGKLTKSGAGSVTLSGAVTHNGGTHIEEGSLQFDGPVSVSNGFNMKLELANGTAATFNGTVTADRLLKSDVTTGPSQSTVTFNDVVTLNTAAAGSSFAQGDLVLSGANGALNFTGAAKQLDLLGLSASRSRLILDNATDANADRISDLATLLMYGNSELRFIGNATTGVQEHLHAFVPASGVTTLVMDAPTTTTDQVANGLVFDTWATGNARSVDNYLSVIESTGTLGQGGENPFVNFSTGLDDNQLIARGNLNGTDLLTSRTSGGLQTATTTATLVGAGTTDNVRLDANEILGAALTVKSLALNGVKLEGSPLTVSSGMILSTTNSELALVVHTQGADTTIFDAQGDTLLSGLLYSASTFQKWGEGNLMIGNGTSGSLNFQYVSSDQVDIQQGTITLAGNNLIGPGSGVSLTVNNGAILDLQTFNQTARQTIVDEGSRVDGSGTLTTSSLLSKQATFGAIGGAATINADLVVIGDYSSSELYVADQTALVLNGSNTLSGRSGSVDVLVDTNGFLTINGTTTLGTDQALVLRGLGDVTLNGTLVGHGFRVNMDATHAFTLNEAVTLNPYANTDSPLSQIEAGTMRLAGSHGALSGAETLFLGNANVPDAEVSDRRISSQFVLDNGGFVNADRLADATVVRIDGQSGLTLIGNAAADVTEQVGVVHLEAGETTLTVQNDPAVAAKTSLQLAGLVRSADNILRVNSSGGTLGAGVNSPNLMIAGASDGFLDQTIVDDASFALYSGDQGIQSATNAVTLSGAIASNHVVLTANETVNAATTLGSLVLSEAAVDGSGALTLDTGHLLLRGASSIANDLTLSGDAFVYAAQDAVLSGDVAATGDLRKAGSGDLLLGAAGKALSVGAGKTLYVDAGSLTTAAASSIADGTDVQLRQSVLNIDHDLTLGQVVLRNRADLLGDATLTAAKVTVQTSKAFVGPTHVLNGYLKEFGEAFATTLSVNLAGNGDFQVDENARVALTGAGNHTGNTAIDGRVYLSGDGAIGASSLIELGKVSGAGELTWRGGVLGDPLPNRIGDTTDVDLYGKSIFSRNGGLGLETVGAVNVKAGASVDLGAIHATSLTATDSSVRLSGQNFADAVTISLGDTVTNVVAGEIVQNVISYVNYGWQPVEWLASHELKAVASVTRHDMNTGSGGHRYVSVSNAQDLLSNQSFDYLEFTSVDPFTSTPGTTLTVTTGLFFNAEGAEGKNMGVDVQLTANNASITSNSILRFNQALTADHDLTLSGGEDGVYVVNNTGSVGGTLTLANGKLVVGEAGSGATFSGDIRVQDGSTLGGSGAITGNVTVERGGSTAPGNSPGTLSIDGDATYDFGSYITMELGQPASDLIDVSGLLTFNGTALKLTGAEGFGIGTYTLFEYGTLAGFGDLSIDYGFGVANNLGFAANLSDNTLNKAIELNVTQLGAGSAGAVPEPTASLLVLLGVATLVARRRR